MCIRFSILALLVVTALVALYFASRDSDLLSLNMNGNVVLPLPVDSYPERRGHCKKGALKIYLFNELPRARYYVFDPRSDRGVLIHTPYAEQFRSSHFPSIAYKASNNVAKKYFDIVKRLMEERSRSI